MEGDIPLVTGNYAVAKFMREFGLRRGYPVSRTIKLFNDNGFVLTFHPVNRFAECSRIFHRNLYGRPGLRFWILKFSLSNNSSDDESLCRI